MSISSEISRISGNVSDAFDAVEDMGGTVTSGATSDDLETAIRSIPTGAGLPSVTAADNGKVLTVVSGAWDKANPEHDFIIQAQCTSAQLMAGITINLAQGTYQEALAENNSGRNIKVQLTCTDIYLGVIIAITSLNRANDTARGSLEITLGNTSYTVNCVINSSDQLMLSAAENTSLFIVNFTSSSGGTWSADKTFAEVYAACNNPNIIIKSTIIGIEMINVDFSPTAIYFSSALVPNTQSRAAMIYITLNSDETIDLINPTVPINVSSASGVSF